MVTAGGELYGLVTPYVRSRLGRPSSRPANSGSTQVVAFGLPPFLYPFITNLDALTALRFVHGFATAIFAPSALATVAELGHHRRLHGLVDIGVVEDEERGIAA